MTDTRVREPVPAAAVREAGSPDTAPPAVRTRGLTKRFRSHLAVDAVDLAVPPGGVYGFLGPNGSGKTTTIRMLLGLIRPDAGELELLGAAMPAAARTILPRVGALVEGPAFHLYLSGRANLARIDAADRDADPRTAGRRIDAALDRVGLMAAATKRYRAYSLGMRQRLAIASALLVPRDLLVLDEPTNGLDPQGTREVRHLVADLAADGATVLVSSHLLAEVEQMCTHVGVMHQGRLVAQGEIASFGAEFGAGTDSVATTAQVDTDQTDAAASVLAGLGLREVRIASGRVTAALGEAEVTAIMPALVAAGVGVLGFAVLRPSLEDAFVALTGEGFDVSG